MTVLPRNNALGVHPPQGQQFLTTNGSNWLFTVTSIFGVTLVRPSLPTPHPTPQFHSHPI